MMNYYEQATELLKTLIATPSVSKEEQKTADILEDCLKERGYDVNRIANNIWAKSKNWKSGQSCILLNSHHDTVKPNDAYTLNPFSPEVKEGKLFGLGSNDAGGALVSLLATFFMCDDKALPANFIFAASAEEEISGKSGMEKLREELPKIDIAIVGEPTQMKMAVAEKGLMVLDCYGKGKPGHAARNEGVNAIYEVLDDLLWFKDYRFTASSASLGPVKMTVAQIEAGKQHNVVPDACHFVVDVRSTDAYTNEEILEIIDASTDSEIKARSTRLQPSGISEDHPMVIAAKELDIATFGSPTLSDQALLSCPSVKIGPGDSARSHTADEFIYLEEIEKGIQTYFQLIDNYLKK